MRELLIVCCCCCNVKYEHIFCVINNVFNDNHHHVVQVVHIMNAIGRHYDDSLNCVSNHILSDRDEIRVHCCAHANRANVRPAYHSGNLHDCRHVLLHDHSHYFHHLIFVFDKVYFNF